MFVCLYWNYFWSTSIAIRCRRVTKLCKEANSASVQWSFTSWFRHNFVVFPPVQASEKILLPTINSPSQQRSTCVNKRRWVKMIRGGLAQWKPACGLAMDSCLGPRAPKKLTRFENRLALVRDPFRLCRFSFHTPHTSYTRIRSKSRALGLFRPH